MDTDASNNGFRDRDDRVVARSLTTVARVATEDRRVASIVLICI